MKKKKNTLFNIIITVFSLILVSTISISYAALNQNLNIKGKVALDFNAGIQIVKIESNQASCGYDIYTPKYEENSLTINANFPQVECTAEYIITIINYGDYAMLLTNINDETYNNENIFYNFNGIEIGTTVLPNSSVVFTLSLQYNPELTTLPEKTDLGAIFDFIWGLADSEAPIIAIKESDNYTFFSGTDIVLKDLVIVSDNLDQSVSEKLVISSDPANFSNTYGGNYTIKYNVTDASGNKADQKEINIYVIEFIKIAAGRFHTLALTRDGYVYSWGHNDMRQLGDGTTTNKTNPIKISNISGAVDISAGYGSSYVVTNEGKVYSWGYGVYGQLGHGSNSNVSSPTLINALNAEKIIEIDAGYHSVIALTEGGRVYTWGLNDYRQVGDGTVTAKSNPYLHPTLSGIKYISIGYWHGVAATDTDVYVWGSNVEGQIGTGGTNATTPTKSTFTGNIKQVSAGGRHTFILTQEGNVYVTGYNAYGQAGVGSTSTVTSFRLISTLANIAQVDAGYQQSVAITNSGDVYVWGYNAYAMLGLGNTSTQTSPVLNKNLIGMRYAVAQYETNHYINSVGGEIFASGYNLYGGLGNGTTSNSNSASFGSLPSKVIFK